MTRIAPVLRRVAGAALLGAALVAGAATPPAPGAQRAKPAAAASSAPSEAERLVFIHPHLAQLGGPRVLRYVYVEDAEGRPRVVDRAVLTLTAGKGGGCCDAHGDYLTEPMAVKLPDIPDATSNPILLYFLEAEVRLMERTTNGPTAHFRRRIRLALAESATLSDTTVHWGAKTVPARVVRISPYIDDQFRDRFAGQAAMEYDFVLSDAVPGGVYQMSATLPGASAGSAPLARRTLTLEEPK